MTILPPRAQPSTGNMSPGVVLVTAVPPADLLTLTWHRSVAFISSILHIQVSTDWPSLLWHWPSRVVRCSRLEEGEVFENKSQQKRVDSKKLVDYWRFYNGAAVIYENRGGCELERGWVILLVRIFSDLSEVLVLRYNRYSRSQVIGVVPHRPPIIQFNSRRNSAHTATA